MYQQILFAGGVRLARRGRDLRRDSLRARGHRGKDPGIDPPQVEQAFQGALESFDRVLQVNSEHVKAIMMKGATLYRMDRRHRRDEVRQLYRGALERHPDSQELQYALATVERHCEACSDIGQCLRCHGTGLVSAVLFKSTCPECRGSGVCRKCAIL